MAVTGAEAQITEALLDKVAAVAASLSPVLRVANPNVSFTPDLEDAGGGTTRIKPYLTVGVLPNTSALTGLAFNSAVQHVGLLALNVIWPAGQGVIKPLQLAAQIVGAFKPGTVVSKNGLDVRVYEQPRVAPDQQESDRVTIPIIVRWEVCTPPNS